MKIHFSCTLLLAITRLTQQQSSLEGLASILSEGIAQSDSEPEEPNRMFPEYDFIIVGAGTAGCVVANRLSENPRWKILLIEAGSRENFLSDVPLFVQYLQATHWNWKYKTQPSDKFCLGMENQQCNFPRGKIVGGSSVLNFMIYNRGNRRDYDNWARLGNVGWSYEEVLPYFKKLENFEIPDYQNSSYHGRGGPVNINYAPTKTKVADAFLKASQEYGVNLVDYNGERQIGVSRIQANLKNGVRESSSRRYLHPIKNRPNFHLKKESQVTRILIDSQTKVANGVEFAQNGVTYRVKATKEVILSAGAIDSPKLMMLSGIGPKKHLSKVGISVIQDLKVGYNLMDHIALGGLTFTIDKPYSLTYESVVGGESLSEYFNFHRGPLSIPGGCEAILFQDFQDPKNPNGYPDIELLLQGGSIASDPALRQDFGIKQNLYDEIYKPLEKRHSFMTFPMLLRPKSRGRLMLKDSNYKSKPIIFPNYFAHRYDIDTIVKGAQLMINITKQPAFEKIGTKLHDIPIKECVDQFQFASDRYFECMARYFTFTIYHQCGTCKMGPRTDKKAVVDPRLRVWGVRGLRVVDASVMPVIPAAHTNAPTFMIGEKGADLIKEDWGWLN